ncbi:MAG: phospholipase [Candidatus Dormibacteraeota bacterium]|nr:phospholipase [Candidatus Dormibacteraeota bacterium]
MMEGPRLSRRQVLAAGAAGGAGLAFSGLGPSVLRALAAPQVCGQLSDIQHVVILIQENRAFDHYFGTHAGVRGFSDSNVPIQTSGPNAGLPIWYQFAAGAPFSNPANTLTPFHIDSSNNNGECTNDITHDWGPQHSAWNNGAMDRWLATHYAADNTNGPMTMGYYTRDDLSYYHALADAFTLCDGYHCSIIGPTDPNRLMSLTASIDPGGTQGGPWLETLVTNRAQFYGTLTWPTYPEQLQSAGVTWKVYSTVDGQYGDNVLPYFKNYMSGASAPTLAANAFANSFPGDFETDAAAGTLPQVSWVLAPLANSEHPPAPTVWGEWATSQAVNALTASPLWSSTVLFVTWDENGGFFDHVPPPTADPGTPGEWITVNPLPTSSPHDAQGFAGPLGLGFRVPLLVVSPFSRGGYIASDVFDHTSLLRFLETRFGVEVPNLSAWRRANTGDLTSALNLASVDQSVPTLPAPSLTDSRAVGANSNCPVNAPSDLIDSGLPTVTPYTIAQPNPALPSQEAGSAKQPSGLSCTEPVATPTGPPLGLAVAGAAALGIAALVKRYAARRG